MCLLVDQSVKFVDVLQPVTFVEVFLCVGLSQSLCIHLYVYTRAQRARTIDSLHRADVKKQNGQTAPRRYGRWYLVFLMMQRPWYLLDSFTQAGSFTVPKHTS